MATARPRDRYLDIVDACDRVLDYAEGLTAQSFREAPMAADAIERQLLILAEAAAKLGDRAEADIPGQPWPQIRAIGNVLRHEYDRVDSDVIWQLIAEGHVTALRDAVQRFLDTQET